MLLLLYHLPSKKPTPKYISIKGKNPGYMSENIGVGGVDNNCLDVDVLKCSVLMWWWTVPPTCWYGVTGPSRLTVAAAERGQQNSAGWMILTATAPSQVSCPGSVQSLCLASLSPQTSWDSREGDSSQCRAQLRETQTGAEVTSLRLLQSDNSAVQSHQNQGRTEKHYRTQFF